MIHMPSKSSQKYPKGLLVAVPNGSLPSLPSMALRLVANLQSCLRFGVATSDSNWPFTVVSDTEKQGCGTVVAVGSCIFWIMASEQGFAAKPFGVACRI